MQQKGKKASPALRRAYSNAMQANSRLKRVKSYGSPWPKAQKHVVEALEKAFNSPKNYYLPKLVGGSKKQYKAIKGQRVVYIRNGPEVSICRTEGKIGYIDGRPTGYDPHPIQRFLKVGDTWVRVPAVGPY